MIPVGVALLIPRFWSASFQSCEKINLYCFRPPTLWYFVTASLGNYQGHVQSDLLHFLNRITRAARHLSQLLARICLSQCLLRSRHRPHGQVEEPEGGTNTGPSELFLKDMDSSPKNFSIEQKRPKPGRMQSRIT